MKGNESMPSGDSPGDGTACGASVQGPSVLDDSVRDRLAWIDERVAVVAVAIVRQVPRGGSVSFDACQILGVVTEFAELLRVHYAGGE